MRDSLALGECFGRDVEVEVEKEWERRKGGEEGGEWEVAAENNR